MSVIKDLAEEMICAIVDHPDDVCVDETKGTKSIILDVHVRKTDLGHVIGSQGKNIDAIRTVLRAAGSKEGFRVDIDLIES